MRDDEARGGMSFDESRAVVVFPGQSSSDAGMRQLLEQWRPRLLEVLSSVAGHDDPFSCTDTSIATAQAVTVACGLAYWYAQGRPTPRYMIGHSLGELTALAAAGSISEEDSVRVAAVRGELMQRACDATGGCAVMEVRAPIFDIEAIAEECGISVAFHDGPRQVVVGGTRDGLERARAEFADVGIACDDVHASVGFNSPLMDSAVDPFRAELERCEVQPPQSIVYSAATCRPLIDVRAELAHNLVRPVRWWETLARLAVQGVENFIEIPLGGLLSPLPAGLAKQQAHDPRVDALWGDAACADEAAFAYFDDENRLHVLV